MNTINIKAIFLSSFVLSLFVVAMPTYALSTDMSAVIQAKLGSSTTAEVRVNASASTTAIRITNGKNRADQEINRRVTILNDAVTRVSALVRLSADQKSSLNTFLQGQLTAMANLKAKIDADTDLTILKTDIGSITVSYRIFALIVPQVRLISTVDSLLTTGDSFTALSAKLQTRITALGQSGTDTTSLTALLNDMNAKVSDSSVQAQAAVTLVQPLQPDNGDKATQQANKTAFTTAQTDVKTSRADLATARNDAQKIITALKSAHVKANVTASTTVNTQ